MKKLKILQVNKLYYPYTGGVERVVQQIAEGLAEQTEMKVLVCNKDRETVVETINGVEVQRSGSFAMLGNLPLSIKFIRDFQKMAKNYDIVHFHMPFPIGDFAGLLSGYEGKIVLWWHSDVVRQKKMMLLYRPIMERFLKRADAIVVATQGHIDGSAYLKPYADKCIVIPYGVNPAIEEKADEWLEKEHSPQKIETADAPVKFLFAGRLVYYKGCKVLLEAFRQVKRGELYLVGSGMMEAELKSLAERFGINDRVHFLGNVSDEELGKNFEKCDVFVLPSIARSEAFGLVQIEAMAYEKPVINTNLASGVPYVSIHEETGLTVEPEDAAGLADAMNWMVEHPEERRAMGRKGRRRVKEVFQMETMLEQLMKVYHNLVGEDF